MVFTSASEIKILSPRSQLTRFGSPSPLSLLPAALRTLLLAFLLRFTAGPILLPELRFPLPPPLNPPSESELIQLLMPLELLVEVLRALIRLRVAFWRARRFPRGPFLLLRLCGA